MTRLVIAAGVLVSSTVLLLQACGPGDDCEVTLTCDAPAGGAGGQGGTSGPGGEGGAGGGTSKADGEACAAPTECASGACVDAVCCATACDGTCESCALSGSEGTCSPHAAASDPDDECSGDGVCDGGNACAIGEHLFSTKWGTDQNGVWVEDVAVTPDGDVWVGGWFSGDFLVGGSKTLIHQGSDTAWLAKLDASGNYVWAREYGQNGSGHFIHALATDDSGNVIVTGYHGATPSTFLNGCDAVGGNYFVMKVDGNGTPQWCHDLPTRAVAAAGQAGEVTVAGDFTGTVDFGGTTTAQTATNWGTYLLRINAIGNAVWALSYDNTNRTYVDDVSADDSGNLTLVGRFETSAAFGGAPVTSAMAGLFVTRFQATGEPVWTLGFGDDVLDARGVSSSDGRVLVTGRFAGSIDLGGGAFVSNGTDGFIASLDASGAHQWSHHATGSGANFTPRATTWDDRGNAISAASFSASMTLNDMPFSTPANTAGLLIVKHAATGEHLWSRSFSTELENTMGLGTDPAGNIWWGGDYFGTLNLGGDDLVSTNEDSYLVKYGP